MIPVVLATVMIVVSSPPSGYTLQTKMDCGYPVCQTNMAASIVGATINDAVLTSATILSTLKLRLSVFDDPLARCFCSS